MVTSSLKDSSLSLLQAKLDNIGCELGCSTMTDHTQDYKFVIARSEVNSHSHSPMSPYRIPIPQAVYFYTPEGRAQAFAFEGFK